MDTAQTRAAWKLTPNAMAIITTLTAANAGLAMHPSLTSKLFGRRMTRVMCAVAWLKKTRRDFVRATSRESSVCACRAHRSAGSRIVEFLRRIVCLTHLDFARRYHACRMHASGLRGALLALLLIVTKQHWHMRTGASNSAGQLRVSNWCNRNLFGWRRKLRRRSYWRCV